MTLQMTTKTLFLLVILSMAATGFGAADNSLAGMHLIAKDNCGVDGQQPHHVMGANWAIAV